MAVTFLTTCGFAEGIPAEGGDQVYTLETATGTDYVHIFTATGQVATFRNTTANPLYVRYLVVGGGGAGGTASASTSSSVYGAGGGGGGGVAGAYATLAPGETWSVQVGAGGQASSSLTSVRVSAGASSISNGAEQVVFVPGGGGGAFGTSSSDNPGYYAEPGAAGGGASYHANGGSGTFASYEAGREYGYNKGGNRLSLAYTNASDNTVLKSVYMPGGGGGAGGAGETAVHAMATAGAGGVGVTSDITGEVVAYGGGGGGGGDDMPSRLAFLEKIGFPDGFRGGLGMDGGGRGGYYSSAENVHYVAEAGTDGRGGGGGGAMRYNGGKKSPGSSYVMGGNGGSGTVIFRYAVVDGSRLVWRQLGAKGEVTFECTALATRNAAGEVVVMAGTTAHLKATDAGGALCTCWRADATGEIFYGNDIDVAVPEATSFTACFATPWTYNSSDLVLTDGRWSFVCSKNSSAKGNIYPLRITEAPEDGYLNFEAPLQDTNGIALKGTLYGIGSTSVETKSLFFYDDPSKAAAQKLTTLVLPQTLRQISYSSFRDCVNLVGPVCIPSNTILYGYVFSGCLNLKGVYFKGEGQTFSDKGYQFAYCTNLALRVTLPASVTNLSEHVFDSCTNLPEVVATNVMTVAANAFYNDYELRSVDLGLNLRSVGASAFYNCSSLRQVSQAEGLPESIAEVGKYGFSGCVLLKGDLRLPLLRAARYYSFNSTKFTSLYLPSVTNIGYQAFYSSPLTNVVFGSAAVTFRADANKPDYYRCFYSAASGCRFWFPGKAPVLEPAAEGCHYVSTVSRFFGQNTVLLLGDWSRDPQGWQKILNEIGTPEADVPASTSRPALPAKCRSVKGTFNWYRSETAVYTGWLIDWAAAHGTWLLLH